MKEFNELLSVIDVLLGPGGCPWDREQTLTSMRADILEEVCELIEAIDIDHDPHIQEELGDLFFNVVFFCRLAEKEGRCDIIGVLQGITNKLIRRHPHVFGEEDIAHASEVLERWDQIKGEEKPERKGLFDGIPKGLPALAKAQKMIKRLRKVGDTRIPKASLSFETEEDFAKGLLSLVVYAQEKGYDAEHALRKELSLLEEKV